MRIMKEVNRMRKILFTGFLILLAIGVMYGNGNAITGQCSNCHTMHNSQDGAAVDSGGPNNQLLNAGCVACHTTTTGQTSSFGAPAILHTTSPGTAATDQGAGETLAGGDFYWVNNDETTDADKGHNVADLPGVDDSVKDTNMPNLSPPGWDPVATGTSFVAGQVAGGESAWTSKLTCGGKYGCHGDHTATSSFGGVSGAHHGNTDLTATQASTANTVGNSYRFLYGIKGLEDANWNWSETASTHNEYYGEDNSADRSAGGLASYGSRDTISFLCAECHGTFHGTIDADSTSGDPWVRHPTDITLSESSEASLYNTSDGSSIGTYNVTIPIARSSVPASSVSTVTAATDIVMCLSCHRAHGSPVADLLRFDYTDMVAGSTNTGGCFVCHTSKNASGTNP